MSWYKKLNSLSEIPNCNYDGYIWQSDSNKPERVAKINTNKFENNGSPNNPFIQESYLFDKDNQISISIKHSAGKYLIFQYNLNELPEVAESENQSFLANQVLPGNLNFKEIWLPEKDKNCEGFEVLRKKAVLFIGFKKENNND